jgi:hypothetical protein
LSTFNAYLLAISGTARMIVSVAAGHPFVMSTRDPSTRVATVIWSPIFDVFAVNAAGPGFGEDTLPVAPAL